MNKTAYQLAQLNLAKLQAPLESPQLADFVANLDRINQLAEALVVLWWVPAGHQPTALEAVERLVQLRRDGPTPQAFGFRSAFGAPGAQPSIAARDDTCPAA